MKNFLIKLKDSPWIGRVKAPLLFLVVLSLTHFWSSGYRDALVWGSFLALLVLAARKKIDLKFNAILIAVAVYTAWALVSVFYSTNPSVSFRAWYKLIELAAAAFVIAQLLRSRGAVDKVLLYIVAALTLIYLYDIAIYLRGLGTEWRWGERWDDRWTEILHYNAPNIYSALIVAALPLAFYSLVRQPRRLGIVILSAVHFCAAIFLLYVFASRTAQVALVAMILTLLMFAGGWKRKLVFMSIVLVVIALIVVFNPRFRDPTAKNLFLRDENWRNTYELIQERPWLGYGYGNQIYQEVYHNNFPNSRIPFEHTHNLMLKVIFESGIVGLIAYLPIWIAIFWSLFRIYLKKDSRFQSRALAILLAFFALFVCFLGSIPNGINRCYFWFMAGVAAAILSIYKKDIDKISHDEKIT